MNLREAAEMALEVLETLWDILDDIDTASDMAKENDAWYRKRVEALQKKRWDTMITTDGYKLKGGPVEALRQALAQPVDAVNMSQERVDETAKGEHEPWQSVQCTCGGTIYFKHTKRQWGGLTDAQVEEIAEYHGIDGLYETSRIDFYRAIEITLKEKNCG